MQHQDWGYSMEWINVEEKLPYDGQRVLILWRRCEGSVWQYALTTYQPFLKSGYPKKFPFGNTYEVKAWYPIPKLPQPSY